MSDLDALLSQLRAEAEDRGGGWLQATVSDLLQEPSQASSDSYSGPSHGRPHARRSRLPEHFSPETISAVRRCSGSSAKDSQTPPAKRKPVSPRVRVERNLLPWRTQSTVPSIHAELSVDALRSSNSQVRLILISCLFLLLSLAWGNTRAEWGLWRSRRIRGCGC